MSKPKIRKKNLLWWMQCKTPDVAVFELQFCHVTGNHFTSLEEHLKALRYNYDKFQDNLTDEQREFFNREIKIVGWKVDGSYDSRVAEELKIHPNYLTI
jgi:hypothetical protein